MHSFFLYRASATGLTLTDTLLVLDAAAEPVVRVDIYHEVGFHWVHDSE